MKALIALALLLAPQAYATDQCSLGLAKKFTDAVIAVEVKENPFTPGKLIFNRSESKEYTLAYLNEQIDLLGAQGEGKKYADLKAELAESPDLHIYRMKYKWDADNRLDLGFYYLVRLKNYDRGCTLKDLVTD